MNLGRNLFWRITQQYSVYVIKLLVQIILARILGATEFGLIGIVLAFSSIAEIVAVSGLGTALVQKLKPDEDDYSTVFSFSLLIAAVVYLLLFLFAPLIAAFNRNDALTKLVRVYSFVIFFQAHLAVINAYVQKNALFKKSFFGNLIAVVFAGVVSVMLAYRGFGVWALVVYALLAAIVSIISIQILVHWRPHLRFKLDRFKPLFAFSWKVLVSSLIGSLLENIYSLTIGRYYGEATLGYYKQGNIYPDAVLGQTRTAFAAVMLPEYSSLQNDRDKLRESVCRMTHLVTAFIFPMAFGLAAIGRTFVQVILTEKWLPAVLYLRLECVFFGTLPITTSLGNGIIAVGRSDISAKIEFSKLLATIACVVFLHKAGVEIMCIARVCIAVAFIAVSAVIAHNILSLTYGSILKSIFKPLLFSALMGAAVYAASLLPLKPVFALAVELLVGGTVYGVLTYLFMRDDLSYFLRLFKKGTGQ